MNESVDPCDNFYQYACGNFARVLVEDESAEDFFDFVQNKIEKSVKDVLSDKKVHPSKAVESAKQLYNSCMDTDSMNDKGLAPLYDVLRQIGLPTKSPLIYPSSKFNWVKTAAKMKRVLNMDFLISVNIFADPKNRSINRISVSKSSGYTGSGPDFSNYVRSMQKKRKFPMSSGSNDDKEDPGVELYQYIRSVSNENKFIPDETPVPKLLTIDELQKYTDSAVITFDGKLVLDWKKYITTLFEGTNITLDLESGKDKIAVSDMVYLKEAIQLIQKNQKILESALWWDVIQEIGLYTTDELRMLDTNYRTNGLESPRDRKELCQGTVRKYFSFALAHTFLNDPSVAEYQRQTEEMVENLRLGFDKIIETSDWMDNETKTEARKKLNTMRTYVSHPDWLYNITEIDEYYEDYTIYPKDMLKTIYLFEQEIVNITLLSLRNINDLEEATYDSFPLVTNAFYSSSDNTMIIPMGMIQFPFQGHATQALNYGALGFIVGHEITHGFDTEGKRHDEFGNVRRWWKNDTLAEYKNRTSCFVKSYNQIEIGGENVDGIQTLDENIADNGGYKESLLAYRRYVQTNGTEPLLEGFEGFTNEQLFTLSFANAWCSLSSKVSTFDKHSPEEARVIGVLMNSPEFQDIWKCKKNSPMNPVSKCQIW
ncbi:hypothetical protein V9T40_003103 [Parthenolecanium corni]|uniref:Uncharacterized protein n=1 Tax=Parthenolecanium corni TaxID=536013 RepID=A0AAN9U0Q6_9HEMI